MLAVAVIISLQAFSCLASPAAPSTVRTIKAVVPASFPPYYQVNSLGKPSGFAIDIMDSIAADNNLVIEYRMVPSWQDVFELARSGQADLIPNVGESAEREKFLEFTNPVQTFNIVVFTASDSRLRVQKPSDLAGTQVGVVKTNIGAKIVGGIDGVDGVEFDSFEQALFALLSGDIEALVYPENVGWRLVIRSKQENAVKVVGAPLAKIQRAMGIRKGDAELLAMMNAGINRLKETGRYDEIAGRWFAEKPPFFSLKKLLWLFVAAVISIVMLFNLWRYRYVVNQKKRLDVLVEERTRRLSESEARLHESRNMLQNVINTIPVRVFWKDRGLNYLGCNKLFARDAGLGNEREIIGKDDFDLAWSSQAELYQRDDRAVMDSGEVKLNFEEPQTTPAGDTIWLETSKIPLRDVNNDIIGILGTYQDITSRKNAESELISARNEAVNANKAKSQFLSVISHELRTPLTSIKGALALLSNDLVKDVDDISSMLRIAYENSERLNILVNDILDFEKMASGNMKFKKETLSVKNLVEESVQLNQGYARHFNVNVDFADEGVDGTIAGDRERLLQVLSNLISNAVKHSPENETVSVSIQHVGGNIRVSVADSGDGIPHDFHARVFDEFSQADASDTRSKSGTGLGLAIARNVVEQHGGVIGFDSIPGQGATFYFELARVDNVSGAHA